MTVELEAPRGGPEGFHFDGARCTGCQACRLACTIENELADGASWRQVFTFNPGREEGLVQTHLSMACNHCADAACLKACPARAIGRDGPLAPVSIDPDLCMGCSYCTWACPYDALSLDPSEGVMTKCTSCPERRASGLEPACVSGCPTEALAWGSLEGSVEPRGFGLPESELGPRLALRGGEVAERPPRGRALPADAPRDARIGLRHEWPLAAFTLLATATVAWGLAQLFGWVAERALATGALFLSASALASLHLKQPRRAWRAILGWRTSWLSREILCWNAFAGCYFGGLLAGEAGSPVRAVATVGALACGFGTWVAIDGVYRVLHRRGPAGAHSASALLTGPLLLALAAGWSWGAGLLLLAKAGLFWRRRALFFGPGGRGFGPGLGPLLFGARSILALGAGAWLFLGAGPWPLFVAVLLGEALDRATFYEELVVWSPRRQLAVDLAQARR